MYDELNDNIDTYEGRKSDLRKALKAVIEGDAEFQSKLRAFKDSVTAGKEDTKDYEFLLSNAVETVDTGAQDHRQLLAEQEEAFKHFLSFRAPGFGARNLLFLSSSRSLHVLWVISIAQCISS